MPRSCLSEDISAALEEFAEPRTIAVQEWRRR